MKANLNGKEIEFCAGQTILDVARENSVFIPSLCEMHEIDHRPGTCRVCTVQIQRAGETDKHLVTACNTPFEEGLQVFTKNKEVRKVQKLQTELIMADHNTDCTTCARHGDCELQDVAKFVGLSESKFHNKEYSAKRVLDDSAHSIVRDMSKCIRCGRCVTVCRDIQGVAALTFEEKGMETQVNFKDVGNLSESVCASCGQCTLVCPVGALYAKNDVDKVIDFIDDPEITTVVQFAPATRVALGEEFGAKRGSIYTGQMVSAFKELGIDVVLDTNFTADVVIMEEGTELLHRVKDGGTLPLFTSCSPGWINYIEKHYPEMLDHVSTAKSPQQCFGALAKTYLAEKMNIDAKKMRVISIMPCTAKKEECKRPEHTVNGMPEVDVVLTTRELAELLKREQIDASKLPETKMDNPFMSDNTGAAVIFGATGGVMEAAIRTVYEIVNGEALPNLDIHPVRGYEETIKEASVELKGLGEVKVAVVHGLKAAKEMVELVKSGNSPYTFIEFMACPGGCMGGGGQPKYKKEYKKDIVNMRKDGIYTIDKNAQLRKSHENPMVTQLYKDFLGEPCGHKSHELLHTHYNKGRKKSHTGEIREIWNRIK